MMQTHKNKRKTAYEAELTMLRNLLTRVIKERKKQREEPPKATDHEGHPEV